MMFRKLYWVTEQVEPNGKSHVTGVYTSIPNLLRHSFPHVGSADRFRLTLSRLDAEDASLGRWQGPGFKGIEQDLLPFVQADDFTAEHFQWLVAEVKKLSQAAA